MLPVRLVLGQQRVVQHGSVLSPRRKSALFIPKAMRCRLCSYNQPHKHGYYQQGASVTSVLSASIPLLIRFYRRQLKPEEVHTILNRTLDGSSLRGWFDGGRADGTVVHQSCAASQKRR